MRLSSRGGECQPADAGLGGLVGRWPTWAGAWTTSGCASRGGASIFGKVRRPTWAGFELRLASPVAGPASACHLGTPRAVPLAGSNPRFLQSKRPRKRGLFDWSQLQDSNLRPADYESAALPAELSWRWPPSLTWEGLGINYWPKVGGRLMPRFLTRKAHWSAFSAICLAVGLPAPWPALVSMRVRTAPGPA